MMPKFRREVPFDHDLSFKARLRHKIGNTGSSHGFNAHYTTYYTPGVARQIPKRLE